MERYSESDRYGRQPDLGNEAAAFSKVHKKPDQKQISSSEHD